MINITYKFWLEKWSGSCTDLQTSSSEAEIGLFLRTDGCWTLILQLYTSASLHETFMRVLTQEKCQKAYSDASYREADELLLERDIEPAKA